MLYQELQVLTRDEATYNEFLAIEKLYMADEAMTKRQAAELWSKMYGPAFRYKNKIEVADRLRYHQMSQIWNELYAKAHSELKDAETGLRFTLLSWRHPKLGKNVLTLAAVLKKGSKPADSVLLPLPMTEIGENIGGIWPNRATPTITIIQQ